MKNYRKLIVAAVGIAALLIRHYAGIDFGPISPEIVDAIISVGTLIGVERVRNDPT